MTFRHMGFEQCEAQVEYFLPGSNNIPPTRETVTFSDVNATWCRGIFERALDQFLDTLLNSMGGADVIVAGASAN